MSAPRFLKQDVQIEIAACPPLLAQALTNRAFFPMQARVDQLELALGRALLALEESQARLSSLEAACAELGLDQAAALAEVSPRLT